MKKCYNAHKYSGSSMAVCGLQHRHRRFKSGSRLFFKEWRNVDFTTFLFLFKLVCKDMYVYMQI